MCTRCNSREENDWLSSWCIPASLEQWAAHSRDPKAPFTWAPPWSEICLLSGGSLHWSLLSRRMTGQCPLLYADYKFCIVRSHLWGNQIETDHLSVSIQSTRLMGNRSHIRLFLVDQMAAGVSGHISSAWKLTGGPNWIACVNGALNVSFCVGICTLT